MEDNKSTRLTIYPFSIISSANKDKYNTLTPQDTGLIVMMNVIKCTNNSLCDEETSSFFQRALKIKIS